MDFWGDRHSRQREQQVPGGILKGHASACCEDSVTSYMTEIYEAGLAHS